MQASWRRGILITSFDSQISSEVCMAKASKPVNKTVKISDKGLPIDIGISDKERAAVAVELSKMLADSYTLYMMTHNFHWNVTGPQFNPLHTMFMTQYTDPRSAEHTSELQSLMS